MRVVIVVIVVARRIADRAAGFARCGPKQARDALNSVAMNLAEGSGRNGGDRQQHFSFALGSLRELSCAFEIATAHGWFVQPPCALERDRLGGMLWRLKQR